MSETGENAAARRDHKSPSAFRTISEVAEDLELPAHVLRFWESKFPRLKPLKRGGGRRYYRPEDILLLRRIRQCLYEDGYTIRGAQQLLNDDAGGSTAGAMHAMTELQLPSLFGLRRDGEIAAMPTLPAAGKPTKAASEEPAAPARPRRPARRRITPEVRDALEEVRRELLEAKAALQELARRLRGEP